MADAFFQFSRDGGATWDSGDQGFDAQPSDAILVRLKNRPSTAGQVRFQVWDPAGFDRTRDVITNPPRQSKGAPLLTLVGATSGSSVSPSSVDGTVQFALSATRFVSYIIRCVIDGGGYTTLPNGRVVVDPTKFHQRMIVVRDANNLRPIVASETTEYEDDGWAAAFASLTRGPTGPTGPTGGTGATGATGPATQLASAEWQYIAGASGAELWDNFSLDTHFPGIKPGDIISIVLQNNLTIDRVIPPAAFPNGFWCILGVRDQSGGNWLLRIHDEVNTATGVTGSNQFRGPGSAFGDAAPPNFDIQSEEGWTVIFYTAISNSWRILARTS